MHLGAPGVDIVSTTRNGGYAFFNGTSMAAPHVAGAAALMLAIDGNLGVAELTAGLLGTVDPLPTLQGLTVTGGRLNLNGAVRSVAAQPDFRMDLASPAVAVRGPRRERDLRPHRHRGQAASPSWSSLSVLGVPAGAAALFTPDVVATPGDLDARGDHVRRDAHRVLSADGHRQQRRADPHHDGHADRASDPRP